MSGRGMVWEKRIASHLRALGYFTRSNLRISTTGSQQDFVEIDLVGIAINPLKLTKLIGECKSGKARTGDLFRLLGLALDFGADKVFYAKKNISGELIKYFYTKFGLSSKQVAFITKNSDLKSWELEDLIELASYNSIFNISRIKNLFENNNKIKFLISVIRFFQGSYWITEATENIKKFPNVFSKIAELLILEENEEKIGELRKIFFEAIILFSISVLTIVSEYFHYSEEDLETLLREKIIFSPFSEEELLRLERKINDFLRLNCDNFTKYIELTSKPFYIDYIRELVWRIKKSNVNLTLLLFELEKVLWTALGYKLELQKEEVLRKQIQNIINISLRLTSMDSFRIRSLEEKLGLSQVLKVPFLN